MNRRQMLLALASLGALPRVALAAPAAPGPTLIGAAWRGPNPGDPYFAGILAADWQAEKLAIRYAVPLPTRPHGLTAEAGGGLLVVGVRPGGWMLRCDGEGRIVNQVRAEEEGGATRFSGHAAVAGERLYTSETEVATGRGRVGVRDARSLQKLAEWDTHGIDPHQLVLDPDGNLIVANGGVPRTIPGDKKHDLQRMDSSLVRLATGDGRLLRQWRLEDPRLSLRHLAWNRHPEAGDPLLGIALQAEHDDPAARAAAPLLAVLRGDELSVPTRANDGIGYAGDIAAAYRGGFAVSSHQAGVAQVWHPGAPEQMTSVVKFKEAYALASWPGSGEEGGLVISTAYGAVRWLPAGKAAFLAWPEPMAVDNHWVLAG